MIAKLREEETKLSDAYHASLRVLKTNIRALQQVCAHERTRYHPDPSGNGDSSYECLDCGKEDI